MWEDLDFQSSIKELKKAGPQGHTLAHITPEEGKLLQAFGGSGRINPNTKLPQYDTDTYGNASDSSNSGTTGYFSDSYSGGDPRYGRGGGDGRRNRNSTLRNRTRNNTTTTNNTTTPTPTPQDDGPSEAELARRAAAAAEVRRVAEAARQARITAGRDSVTARLNTLAGTEGYDTSGYGDVFSSEFADDLQEDYTAAQLGLDRSFLESSNYDDFHGEGNTLADQQAALDALLTGGEQTSLDEQAAAYQASAQGDYDAWLAENQAAIGGINSEIDYAGFDFTDLDLSGYDSPTADVMNEDGTVKTAAYDPQFFNDYRRIFADPEEEVEEEDASSEDSSGTSGSSAAKSSGYAPYTPTSPSTSSRRSTRIV